MGPSRARAGGNRDFGKILQDRAGDGDGVRCCARRGDIVGAVKEGVRRGSTGGMGWRKDGPRMWGEGECVMCECCKGKCTAVLPCNFDKKSLLLSHSLTFSRYITKK